MNTVPLAADATKLDRFLADLSQSGSDAAPGIEREIRHIWSQSGSASMDLLLGRGRDAIASGDLDQAIAHLTALTDHAPNFAEGFATRARAYFEAGLMGPAVADLETTLALNPRHFEAIGGLGSVFEELGRPKQAYAAYQQALSIHPHFEQILEAVERLKPLVAGSDL